MTMDLFPFKTEDVIDKDVPAGGTLEVLATDPGSVADFAAFCKTTGNELVESAAQDGIYRFLIRHTG